MAKIITRKANTIIVNRFIVGKALDAFRTLVSEHNGEIGLTETKLYKATFKDTKTATLVADALNRAYDEHNVRMPEPKKAKGSAPKTEKTDEPKYIKALKPLAGKGKSANKDAAARLRAIGLEPNGEAWNYWTSIR